MKASLEENIISTQPPDFKIYIYNQDGQIHAKNV